MNILVDIGHPAHVHYFKNLIRELEKIGHRVIITTKDIPVIRNLLSRYGFEYTLLPGKGKGLAGKVIMQFWFDWKLFIISKREKIDLALGVSISVAHLSKLSGIKSIFFEDDDDAAVPLSARFGHPYATTIISPDCLRGKQRRKDVVYYPGYHELAYLHPARFTPDRSILQEAGILLGEKFFIMRFNALDAHHDSEAAGISMERKLQLINILQRYGRIFITTEKEIEPELKEYRLPVPPEKIHSLLYYATLFIGDSQTMASEAAMLGVPSLRCNSFAGRISYLEDQEMKYGLTFGFKPEKFDDLLHKLNELLSMPDLHEKWQERRKKMLVEKIDVTLFWTWFVHNYPESINTLYENPSNQYSINSI